MILVAGATGHLGSEIVRRLRSRGEEVRGLVRATSAPEKIAALRNAGAEVYTGNLRDKESLEAACKGIDTVISTVTAITTAQPGDSFQDTDAAGTIALIEAAKHAGVSHFIFVSFEASRFPDTPLTDAKRAVEQHLTEGGIDYTILQPPPFMEIWLGPMLFGDPRTGEVKIFGNGEGKVPYVSMYDVAEVAVRSVRIPSARNRTIVFSGPQGVTQREAVKVFEEAIGKPLNVTAVPQQALEEQWKTSDNPFQKTFAGLMLGLSKLDAEPMPLSDEYAFEMATVGDYAKKMTQSS
ncbi:MAG TPA: SDR family oxidoreductase [Gemmatimonadaceae bacterium]|nr:SDR family oxidoreductase [Gemmatimonadaceae bacterium]